MIHDFQDGTVSKDSMSHMIVDNGRSDANVRLLCISAFRTSCTQRVCHGRGIDDIIVFFNLHIITAGIRCILAEQISASILDRVSLDPDIRNSRLYLHRTFLLCKVNTIAMCTVAHIGQGGSSDTLTERIPRARCFLVVRQEQQLILVNYSEQVPVNAIAVFPSGTNVCRSLSVIGHSDFYAVRLPVIGADIRTIEVEGRRLIGRAGKNTSFGGIARIDRN